ncbi:MAG: DUF2062 domain-containing protein [FCB group bacterium]|jgi:uncharacterized protein (DUF2062 family)|nr:DUF2062 domain-containing protein [FCB group bacterium]
MDMRRRMRYLWLRVLRQKDEPERIAGGMALGVFLGFLFPPGVQMIVALALAPLFRFNLLASALGTWVTNPLTIPFIYPTALSLGMYITGLDTHNESVPLEDERFWAFITDFRLHGRAAVLLGAGLLTMGAASALPVYYATKGAVFRFQRRRRKALGALKDTTRKGG